MAITQELIERRDRDSKHFETDVPGQFVARLSQDIHYKHPDGYWDDIENLISSVAGGWVAHTEDVRWGVENGYLTITYRGKSLTMRPTSVAMVDTTAPASRFRSLANANYSNVSRSGNKITVTDIFPNTDLEVMIFLNSLSKKFVVRSKPNIPDPISLGWNPARTYIAFIWDVTKPAGATIKDAVTQEVVSSGYIGKNDLVVEDNLGNPVVYFKAGHTLSSSRLGRTEPVWYASAGASIPFAEAITYEVSQLATYPLFVDPTSTINLAAGADDGLIWREDYYNAGSYNYATSSSGMYLSAGVQPWDDGKGGWGTSLTRSYIKFNLSSITGSCVLANLSLTPWFNFGTSTINIYKTSDWGGLGNEDWDVSVISVGSFSATDGPSAIISALTNADIQASFGSNLFLTLRRSSEAYGDGSNYFWSYSYEGTSGSGRPYLEITYTSLDQYIYPNATTNNTNWLRVA